MQGSSTAILALIAFPPLTLLFFALLPPRRAVLATFFVGFLFLPVAASLPLSFVPDYAKLPVISYSAILGVAFFDPGRLLSYRARLLDLPMLAFCLSPLLSSLSNDLGAYDGLSAASTKVVRWGIPFFLGRIYFTHPRAHRELAIAIFLAGLVYTPLTLLEIRLSPQLHNWVYGYYPAGLEGFSQAIRMGGFRPFVFMKHGLTLGTFMTTAALVGWVLWRSGALIRIRIRWRSAAARRVLTIPIGPLAALLLVTTVLCKSLGALVLLFVGIGALWFARFFRTAIPVLVLAALPCIYVGNSLFGLVDPHFTTEWIGKASEDRAQSVNTRFFHQGRLVEKALKRPVLGWGGWGRSRIVDEYGRDVTLSDGAWVIILGQQGLMGLVSYLLAFLLPPLIILLRLPPGDWMRPGNASIVALATVILLYMSDMCLNGSLNPTLVLSCGALTSLAARSAGQPVWSAGGDSADDPHGAAHPGARGAIHVGQFESLRQPSVLKRNPIS